MAGSDAEGGEAAWRDETGWVGGRETVEEGGRKMVAAEGSGGRKGEETLDEGRGGGNS